MRSDDPLPSLSLLLVDGEATTQLTQFPRVVERIGACLPSASAVHRRLVGESLVQFASQWVRSGACVRMHA